MARSYAVTTPNSTYTASATVAFASIYQAGATVRARLYELIVGSNATPGDQAARWAIQRNSSAPSGGTGQTPAPLDSGDPASINTAMIPTITGQGTIGAMLLEVALNQRATFRWVAAPGKELVTPATANAGLCLMLLAQTGAYVVDTTMFYEE